MFSLPFTKKPQYTDFTMLEYLYKDTVQDRERLDVSSGDYECTAAQQLHLVLIKKTTLSYG